jgi:DNA-binding transcriptional ArsR family regulator
MITRNENASNDLQVDVISLKKAALSYRAINHKLRQQMLKLMHAKKEIAVTDLYTTMNLQQSVASQHLGILRRADIVITRRDSKRIFYSINYDRIKQLNEIANSLLN